MNPLLRYTLMNPRTVLVALGLAIALAAGGIGFGLWKSHELTAQTSRADYAELAVANQNELLRGIKELGDQRAEIAAAAVAEARRAGAANRAEADRLLRLQPPPGADQCAAAQQLIDQYAGGGR